MIQVSHHTRIFICVKPVDFRKGIDGFSALCRLKLLHDPFSGSMFVFRNKRGCSIKILCYDGQGYWLLHKRLSKGKFSWWPQSRKEDSIMLEPHEFQQIIWNICPEKVKNVKMWQKVPKKNLPAEFSTID